MPWQNHNNYVTFSSILCLCDIIFVAKLDLCLGETSYPACYMFSEPNELLLYGIGHQFFLCTFWANYIFCVSYESFSYHGCFTRRTNKTVVVPMSSFEGYKSSTSNTYRMFHQNVTIVDKWISNNNHHQSSANLCQDNVIKYRLIRQINLFNPSGMQ